MRTRPIAAVGAIPSRTHCKRSTATFSNLAPTASLELASSPVGKSRKATPSVFRSGDQASAVWLPVAA
jgi:hypothetical protein